MHTIPENAKLAARALRKKQTSAERKLWDVLRNRQFIGKKFLRQYPIVFEYQSQRRFFITDFYCHEAKVAIELDGKSHDYQKDYDELRTFIINELGIRVIRFKNEEIECNMKKVSDNLRGLIEK